MRVAALWFPDWPVQAATLDAADALQEPIAIATQHRIKVCSQAARRAGVRRGMRVRNAQALAPELTVVDDNPDRDGRMFASLAGGLDDVAASVEVLRPGLIVADLQAAARFHGSEDAALEMMLDAAQRSGIEAFVGAADELATAVIATRSSQLVAPGKSAQFLAAQPLNVLVAEVALGADIATVNALGQLGITTLGQLAQLPPQAVTTRFGTGGMRIHRIASAAPDRRVAPELPAADLAVGLTPEDPIERVDAAAFAARALAATLHERLAERGASCLRLKVSAELATGERVERVWRTREALTESATADRVRWQLDGWLTAGGAGAITSLILEPLELAAPEERELFGGGAAQTRGGARRVIERVQSQLGIDAVVQPRVVGGRGVAERIAFSPFGEQPPATAARPWPGAIPAPLPARLGGGIDHPASRIMLIDAHAHPITVTAEALLSSAPYALAWGEHKYLVTGWAGPWPVDEGWWGAAGQRVARLQVVGEDASTRGTHGTRGAESTVSAVSAVSAWLLVWTRRSWRVEAVY